MSTKATDPKSKKTASKMSVESVLGEHPESPHVFGECLSSADGYADQGVPHRVLKEIAESQDITTEAMKAYLVEHHASDKKIELIKRKKEAFEKHGYSESSKNLQIFPRTDKTRKGNLAEVLLAEYIKASSSTDIPIYRLRYNPNIDQSMKGDDVLVFDLDSDPVRIIIGEAKFRTTPSKQVVDEIAHALQKSHSAGLPLSLQFVANCLIEEGKEDIADRILDLALLLSTGMLKRDYVGLLVSNNSAESCMNTHIAPCVKRLAVLSLNLDDPQSLVNKCYEGLE